MHLKYYKCLDGLRGLAALMVMWFHFMPDSPSGIIHLLHKAAVFGQTGVTLFFVLSGFLITRILIDQKNQPHYFRNFYIRRSLRIFPLYYLGLCIYYFIEPLLVPADPHLLHRSWMYWVYLQNLSDTFNWGAGGPQHYWSLAVEEHFYLFWPLIIFCIGNRQLLQAIIVVIITALLCRWLLLANGYGVFYFTPAIMDSMAMGALLAWLEKSGEIKKMNFGLMCLFSLLLLLPVWLFTGGKGLIWIQVFKFPIIAFFYMSIIGLLISKQSTITRFFQSGIMRYTGKISYGLYIFHPICYAVFFHYWATSSILLNWICCLSIALVVATISFYLFEIRFVKLKRFFEFGQWSKKQTEQFE